MTPHQREKLQANYKLNQQFYQLYLQDLAVCRQMRTQALEACLKMPRLKDSNGQVTAVTIDTIIEEAEKVYAYMTKDGSIEALAEESKVTLLQ